MIAVLRPSDVVEEISVAQDLTGGNTRAVQLPTKERAKELARRLIWRADRGTTAGLRRRFAALDPAPLERLRDHVRNNWSTMDYWDSEVGRRDLEEHAVARLIYDRHECVPWPNAL